MKISITQQEKSPVVCGGTGLYVEDADYCLDGGLYAEMLENRNFEAKTVGGGVFSDDGSYGWQGYPDGSDIALKVKDDRPLYSENPHYLRLTVNQAGAGIKNKAFDGIYLNAGKEYHISFYARSYTYKGAAEVGVYQNGTRLIHKKVKIKPDGQWRRYSFRLKSKSDAARADFCFTLAKTGVIHLDCFSMMPANAVLGVFRRDLAVTLKEMKPAFLRFPGEGELHEAGASRYLWKYSIGQTERRKSYLPFRSANGNPVQSDFGQGPHFGQSLGIGYYEYFRFAQYLGAKPIPTVYLPVSAGVLGEAETEAIIQDAQDIAEFACGGTDTLWGRVRAEMGHAEPFGLEYLAVSYGRGLAEKHSAVAKKTVELLRVRFAEKYPALKMITTEDDLFLAPDAFYRKANEFRTDVCGESISAGAFAAVSDCKTEDGPQANSWECALAEAAYLTGSESGSLAPEFKSYAPLLARLCYSKRGTGLVWFDGNSVYLTPNYYVQKLFSVHTGNVRLNAESSQNGVYVSATQRDAFTFVKAVNACDESWEAEVEGDHDFGALTQIICLHGQKTDCNTPSDPEKIVPEIIAPTGERTLTLPPHSFQVLVFKK